MIAIARCLALSLTVSAALVAVPNSVAAAEPPYRELFELLRTNLVGTSLSAEDFERNASQALLKHFAGRVLVAGEVAETTNGPAVAQRATYDQHYAYLRIGQVNADLKSVLTELASDTNALANIRGLVVDLRFASGNDYAAAAGAAGVLVPAGKPLLDWGEGRADSTPGNFPPWTLPIAVLVNGQTAGGAEAFAAILREAGSGILIGSQTAGQTGLYREFPLSTGQKLRVAVAPIKTGNGEPIPMRGIEPDIKVATRPEHELAWLNDPFMAVASATNSASATNKIVSTFTVRRRVNEAELVRAQKAGKNLDTLGETNPPANGTAKPKTASAASPADAQPPAVRDPVLGRALDLLKGLSLIRGR